MGALTVVAWIAIGFSALCSIYILTDILGGHRQKMAVMNIVWPVTALYMGPVAVWAYRKFGRQSPSTSKPVAKPFWQVVFSGTTHCGAGCTIGDFIGEWIVYLAGFSIAGSLLLAQFAADFVLAYAFGLIFQYFAIAPMRHLSGWSGIKAAIKADTISLVAFEIGMFAWMALAGGVLFHPKLQPNQAVYWFSMQVAMIVGFGTSFPANWWLIRKGLKEKM